MQSILHRGEILFNVLPGCIPVDQPDAIVVGKGMDQVPIDLYIIVRHKEPGTMDKGSTNASTNNHNCRL